MRPLFLTSSFLFEAIGLRSAQIHADLFSKVVEYSAFTPWCRAKMK